VPSSPSCCADAAAAATVTVYDYSQMTVRLVSMHDRDLRRVQELIVVCMTPSTAVASTSQRSSGVKRPRISSGSRDGTESLMIPNLHSLNGN